MPAHSPDYINNPEDRIKACEAMQRLLQIHFLAVVEAWQTVLNAGPPPPTDELVLAQPRRGCIPQRLPGSQVCLHSPQEIACNPTVRYDNPDFEYAVSQFYGGEGFYRAFNSLATQLDQAVCTLLGVASYTTAHMPPLTWRDRAEVCLALAYEGVIGGLVIETPNILPSDSASGFGLVAYYALVHLWVKPKHNEIGTVLTSMGLPPYTHDPQLPSITAEDLVSAAQQIDLLNDL